MLKISEELEQMSASGDFGVALDGLHERVAALEIELDDLRTELDAALRQWNEIVLASGSKTHGGAIGHVAAMRAELGSLRAELEAARKQESDSWRVTAKTFCGTHTTDKEVAEHWMKTGDAYPLYASPVPAKISKGAAQVLIHAAISKNPELLELFYSQAPAQQSESPWQVITNENWNIPKLGQRVILFSNGAIQNDSYTLDQGDDGYFWSRDDVDECPEVKAGDAWMPWPSEFRGLK